MADQAPFSLKAELERFYALAALPKPPPASKNSEKAPSRSASRSSDGSLSGTEEHKGGAIEGKGKTHGRCRQMPPSRRPGRSGGAQSQWDAFQAAAEATKAEAKTAEWFADARNCRGKGFSNDKDVFDHKPPPPPPLPPTDRHKLQGRFRSDALCKSRSRSCSSRRSRSSVESKRGIHRGRRTSNTGSASMRSGWNSRCDRRQRVPRRSTGQATGKGSKANLPPDVGSRTLLREIRRGRRNSRSRSSRRSPGKSASPAKGKTKAEERKVGGRKTKWDMTDPVANTLQLFPENVVPKRRREVYIGNLTLGKVTAEVLREALVNLFQSLPAYFLAYPDVHDPIKLINFPSVSQGMFAFAELVDDVTTSTCIQFSGFELGGRPVRIGRPQYYVTPATGDTPPLDVTPLRQSGVIPSVPDNFVFGVLAANRIRELYFGNLLEGEVTEDVLLELLSPICAQLPEYDPVQGPPVTKVSISKCTLYAFVQFQNAEIATKVIDIFDDTELFGRRLRVGRPSNYNLTISNVLSLPSPPSVGVHPVARINGDDGPSEAFKAGAAAAASMVQTVL